MIPTIPFITQKFNEFNVQMFDGKLTLPPIQLSRARTFVGQCGAKKQRTLLHGTRLYDFHLKFSICFDMTEREWEDTIIHEMIHYYIGVNGLKDTSAHGQLFRQMMTTINERFGRALTISHKSTAEQREAIYSARKVWHVIALVHFTDGRKGLKVLPRIRQRIVAYRTTMLRDPRISRIDLFMSNDTYFNRFPNSSSFNVILAKEDEFMPHIQQAEPLSI
ncbi:MAG: SprT-like domain-containing protein [Prevotella sp.]|nr:SprT-like domain-containing protein [Candidatus Prevotella equi]